MRHPHLALATRNWPGSEPSQLLVTQALCYSLAANAVPRTTRAGLEESTTSAPWALDIKKSISTGSRVSANHCSPERLNSIASGKPDAATRIWFRPRASTTASTMIPTGNRISMYISGRTPLLSGVCRPTQRHTMLAFVMDLKFRYCPRRLVPISMSDGHLYWGIVVFGPSLGALRLHCARVRFAVSAAAINCSQTRLASASRPDKSPRTSICLTTSSSSLTRLIRTTIWFPLTV